MNFNNYLKSPGVNWSTLKNIRLSPKHYKHFLENPREDNVRFALGRGAHTAILEPEKFGSEYAVFDGDRRAGKEWISFAEANENKTILKRAEYNQCLDIAKSVRSHPMASKLLSKGNAEQTLTWEDPVTKLVCKARPDWMCDTGTVDIKTTKTTEQRKFTNQVANLEYHCQAAFYTRGRLATSGELKPFYFVAVELEAPHDVAVYELDADSLYYGECIVNECLLKLKECLEKNEWPSRIPNEIVSLSIPAWARDDDENNLPDWLSTGDE